MSEKVKNEWDKFRQELNKKKETALLRTPGAATPRILAGRLILSSVPLMTLGAEEEALEEEAPIIIPAPTRTPTPPPPLIRSLSEQTSANNSALPSQPLPSVQSVLPTSQPPKEEKKPAHNRDKRSSTPDLSHLSREQQNSLKSTAASKDKKEEGASKGHHRGSSTSSGLSAATGFPPPGKLPGWSSLTNKKPPLPSFSLSSSRSASSAAAQGKSPASMPHSTSPTAAQKGKPSVPPSSRPTAHKRPG
jgi:hypothetical protein